MLVQILANRRGLPARIRAVLNPGSTVFVFMCFCSFLSSFLSLKTFTFIFRCRNGSVIADFTIVYNVSDYRWIEKLKQSISSTGLLYNMPLELEELTAENG